MSRVAVFLDRDGTLIEDREYLKDPSGVRLLPGVPASLRRLLDAGFTLVVITNQSGIGRGWMTEDDYQRVNAEFEKQLAAFDVALSGVYHCSAGPATAGGEEHPDRKPMPGMYLRAARELDLDLAASFAIGDSLRDVIAGQRAGCRLGILVRTGKPIPADLEGWPIADNLEAAVDIVLMYSSRSA